MKSAQLALATRLDEIAPFQVMEVMRAARELEAAGHDVIHLEVGQPDFSTPPKVLAAARAALEDGEIFYAPALGLPELRTAVAAHYSDRYDAEVSAQNIVVTSGASAALMLVMAALLDRDSEVLMADPGYPCNRHFVSAFEGKVVSIAVDSESNYQPRLEDLVAAHSANTRAVLIATPSNPTGTMIAFSVLVEIAHWCVRNRIWLIVDEIYLGLAFEENRQSALAMVVPGIREQLIVVSSFSKFFNMTGWRLGWMVIPAPLVAPIEKLAQNFYISASSLAQHAALAAFDDDTMRLAESRRRELKSRRDVLVPALRSIGIAVPAQPEAGFFLYADISQWTKNSLTWCEALLKATGVAVTPGTDFGLHGANTHVRIAFTVPIPRLLVAVARIHAFLQGTSHA